MAPSPMLVATAQSAALAAASNLIAQALVAFREERPRGATAKKQAPLAIDWLPVLHFVAFALVSTPPNILWQELLESTFPARAPAPADPTPQKPADAGEDEDKNINNNNNNNNNRGGGARKEDAPGQRQQAGEEGKLDVGNTLAKFALDQTVGAALNTLAYSAFMHAARQATTTTTTTTAARSVDWAAAWAAARAAFWPLMTAGWRLWPLVSAVNFALVRTVAARNLVGGLAGLVWGVYVSLAG